MNWIDKIPTGFYFVYNHVYEMEYFGVPKIKVRYLGLVKGDKIICYTENPIPDIWITRGLAKEMKGIPGDKFHYIVNASCFYPTNGKLPEFVKNYRAFEFVSALIDSGAINERNACPKLAYLWELSAESKEISLYRWFVEKMISASDKKITEKNLFVNKTIVKSQLEAAKIEPWIVSVFTMHMDLMGDKLIQAKQEKWRLIVEYQLSQLPF